VSSESSVTLLQEASQLERTTSRPRPGYQEAQNQHGVKHHFAETHTRKEIKTLTTTPGARFLESETPEVTCVSNTAHMASMTRRAWAIFLVVLIGLWTFAEARTFDGEACKELLLDTNQRLPCNPLRSEPVAVHLSIGSRK
jgi:hypothetical protein